ncbi:MAG: hypothetical protein K0U68_10545 [Gammaproteobacteria bacterium]|nr:hypothetical protein [Gammaproteobacteria bacterium]
MRGKNNPFWRYQFALNPATQNFEYGFNSINAIRISGSPSNVDINRWAMLHDSSNYRFYAFRAGSNTQLYQYAFNGFTCAYGFRSINVVNLQGLPGKTNSTSLAMMHDGITITYFSNNNKSIKKEPVQ